jgi:hypothetical protein
LFPSHKKKVKISGLELNLTITNRTSKMSTTETIEMSDAHDNHKVTIEPKIQKETQMDVLKSLTAGVPATHLTFPGSIGFSTSQIRNMRDPLLKQLTGAATGKPKPSTKKKNAKPSSDVVDDIVEVEEPSSTDGVNPKHSLKQKRIASVAKKIKKMTHPSSESGVEPGNIAEYNENGSSPAKVVKKPRQPKKVKEIAIPPIVEKINRAFSDGIIEKLDPESIVILPKNNYLMFQNRPGPSNPGFRKFPDFKLNLTGLNIVSTGVLESFDPDEVIGYLKSNQAFLSTTVTKKIHLAIVGVNAGESKINKLVEQGVPMINEENMLKLLNHIGPETVAQTTSTLVDETSPISECAAPQKEEDATIHA